MKDKEDKRESERIGGTFRPMKVTGKTKKQRKRKEERKREKERQRMKKA